MILRTSHQGALHGLRRSSTHPRRPDFRLASAPSSKGFGAPIKTKKQQQPLDELPPACKCESGKAYKNCCGPIHEGVKVAATAEASLRARFSAFREGKEEFIISTTHPEFLVFHYEGKSADEAKSSYAADVKSGCTLFDYDEFKVTKTEPGASDLESFVAYSYKSAKKEDSGVEPTSERDWKTTNEKGRFLKVDDRWLFADYQRFEFSMNSLLQNNLQSEPTVKKPERDWKLNKGKTQSA